MAKSGELIHIDGSVMEGGGQILRTASALSILTGNPIRMYNIRANRPQPGLRAQHLRGLEAVADLCSGRLEGAKIGSRQIYFYPGKISQKGLKISIETAGSIGLVMHSLLVAAIGAREKITVDIEGGATFGAFAPPLEHVQFVLLPLLRRMGYHAEINIIRHGFYPVGGAQVKVMISPCRELKPLCLLERGEIESIDIVSTASSSLKMPKVAERQQRAAETVLKGAGHGCTFRNRYSEARSAGSGIVILARTDKGCILGSDGLGERGKMAEVVGQEAAAKMLRAMESGATVDEHISDQLLPYMALCREKSAIIAPNLTMHAKTNMFIIKQFLPVEFDTERTGSCIKISCLPQIQSV